MADVKVVRGSLAGVTVQVNEETAGLLGSAFEPEASRSSKSSK